MLSEDGRDQEEQRAAEGSGPHLESLELLWAHRSHSPRLHDQVTRPLECLFCALGSPQTVLRVLSERESHLARRLAVPMKGQQGPCSPGHRGHPGAGRGRQSLLGNSPVALSCWLPALTHSHHSGAMYDLGAREGAQHPRAVLPGRTTETLWPWSPPPRADLGVESGVLPWLLGHLGTSGRSGRAQRLMSPLGSVPPDDAPRDRPFQAWTAGP